MALQNSRTSIDRYAWILASVWTIVAALLLYWNFQTIQKHTHHLAIGEARANFNKDQAFRFWATRHGGVYVPITDHTPANSYLDHIPERDIETPSGKKLTLMNPAYMVRQLNEDYGELFGVYGHITSLNLHRPDNAPDMWEREALLEFERGEKEVSEITTIDGAPYLRLMRPMHTKKGCLKCHGYQGYEVGEIRGGVSVSVPMQKYLDEAQTQKTSAVRSFCGVWGLGLIGLYGLTRRLKKGEQQRVNTLKQTIQMIASTIEKRDHYTAGHQNNVALLAEAISLKMGLPKKQVRGIYFGATIHDIGKIFVPSHILNKASRLSESEFGVIKDHPESGYNVVKDVDFDWPVADMIHQHHERLDGSGYPQGLKGDEIIIEAKILAIADVVDSITSDRPYRNALPVESAIEEIRSGRGVMYDERVVDSAIDLIESGLLDEVHRPGGAD